MEGLEQEETGTTGTLAHLWHRDSLLRWNQSVWAQHRECPHTHGFSCTSSVLFSHPSDISTTQIILTEATKTNGEKYLNRDSPCPFLSILKNRRSLIQFSGIRSCLLLARKSFFHREYNIHCVSAFKNS